MNVAYLAKIAYSGEIVLLAIFLDTYTKNRMHGYAAKSRGTKHTVHNKYRLDSRNTIHGVGNVHDKNIPNNMRNIDDMDYMDSLDRIDHMDNIDTIACINGIVSKN